MADDGADPGRAEGRAGGLGGGYPYEYGAPPGAKAGKGSARSTDRNLRSSKSAHKGNAKKAIQVEGRLSWRPLSLKLYPVLEPFSCTDDQPAFKT
jgi:hypothetical protein